MYVLSFILGMIIGGTISVILYACIIAGKDSEEFFK